MIHNNPLITNIHRGFTLIELMIVIAIVAILATVAIPSYQNYTKKASVTELIQASAPYKTAVELCIFENGNANGCDGGKKGIPANLNAKGKIASLSVANGVITVTGKDNLQGVGYTLTPPATDTDEWQVACTKDEFFPAGFCK